MPLCEQNKACTHRRMVFEFPFRALGKSGLNHGGSHKDKETISVHAAAYDARRMHSYAMIMMIMYKKQLFLSV
jgi:hypothetical protein